MLEHINLIPCYGKGILGWRSMGNSQLDWLLISSVLGIIIFAATTLAVFIWLLRFKPEILQRKGDGNMETTFDWSAIREIILQCSSFSGGLVILLNVFIFLATGIWTIDARSVGVMALAFALMLFRSFDRFLTHLKYEKA